MIFVAAEVLAMLLAVAAIGLAWVREPLAVVILLSVYSALLASLFAALGAVDVAFMEAVVGSTVSTVFVMALMWFIRPGPMPRPTRRSSWIALVPSLLLGSLLVYGVSGLPTFGDPDAPAAIHVSPAYAARSVAEMETPNVVTAVLADYRGFDTMIESAVVVTAVLACLLVLRKRTDPGEDRRVR